MFRRNNQSRARTLVHAPHDNEIGILILAGGEATRLPGKLMLDAGGVPLLARVYRNLVGDAPTREVALACNATNQTTIAALLPVPIIIDRWPKRGPLGGMLTGFEAMHAPWMFVAAGDLPFVDAALMHRLAAAWHAGDECVIPQSSVAGSSITLEPLAALYDRMAFLREGSEVLRKDGGAVHSVVQRLRARLVTNVDPRTFTNVNTSFDYAALRDSDVSGPPPSR